jgi:hypothetical protein
MNNFAFSYIRRFIDRVSAQGAVIAPLRTPGTALRGLRSAKGAVTPPRQGRCNRHNALGADGKPLTVITQSHVEALHRIALAYSRRPSARS